MQVFPCKFFVQNVYVLQTPLSSCLTISAYILEHENIEHWRAGCRPGSENCTRLTLTKIADSSMLFQLPPLSYQYPTANQTYHEVNFGDVVRVCEKNMQNFIMKFACCSINKKQLPYHNQQSLLCHLGCLSFL